VRRRGLVIRAAGCTLAESHGTGRAARAETSMSKEPINRNPKRPMENSRNRYLLLLTGVFAAVFAALAVAPRHRDDWLLENALVAVLLLALLASYRRFPLSRISYTLIFLFLCLHEVGAHYTYSEVPYDAWTRALFGFSFNDLVGWRRNNFDRLVHFCYGLLLAYPVREVFLRIANVRGFWGYFLPLDFTMSTSMMYELIEWGAAATFGGELGAAYLGTQGDIWDAQKDMLLASLGAVLSMSATALINMATQRDFSREWSESLDVKHPLPLDETDT
jgi:putative membrane protein